VNVFLRDEEGEEQPITYARLWRRAGEIAAGLAERRHEAGERVALNLLQRISAVATMTRRFVEKLQGSKAVLLDTRKTMPGLRVLERYGVRVGGGKNHRFCLSDAVMIKDNHIGLVGSVAEAINRVRQAAPVTAKIEVEAENLFQVREALAAGADVIMLDNMGIQDLEQAVALIAGKVPVEASGGVTLERIAAIAQTGVDFISTSSMTRQAGFLDISLEIASVVS
jgi:nicotinate-nucleotide pyrophosphorylase (carboxylating)